MRQDTGHSQASGGRVAGRRALIAVVTVAMAMIALLAGSFKERRAQAAAQQSPTPAPPPDYSNVDDILKGRRHVLRTDDLILQYLSNSNSQDASQLAMQTKDSTISGIIKVADGSETHSVYQDSRPLSGRMYNLPRDVFVTASVTAYGDGLARVDIFVADPVMNESRRSTVLASVDDDYYINSLMMADFDGDGYDDLVLNYASRSVTTGITSNAITIITALDVNSLADGVLEVGPNEQDQENTTAMYNMAVGDFNGDGRPDIIGVEAGEDGTGLRLAYHTVDPKTFGISDGVWLPITNPLSTSGKMVIISPAAGKFTDAVHDQIVVAYYTNEYYPTNNGVRLVVIDFDASMQAQLGPILDTNSIPTDAQTVIKVQTGRFDCDLSATWRAVSTHLRS